MTNCTPFHASSTTRSHPPADNWNSALTLNFVGALGEPCLSSLTLSLACYRITGRPINAPTQHTLSTHPINTLSQPTLTINPPTQHTLSTHPINTTHPIDAPSQPTHSTQPIGNNGDALENLLQAQRICEREGLLNELRRVITL